MKRNLIFLSGMSILAIATSSCSSSTDFKPINAKKSLEDVKSSNLVVVPKYLATGYSLTTASADTGGGSQPLSGTSASKAKRFSGQFAKNGSAGSEGGYLNWCVARPEDFDKSCGEVSEKIYFAGKFKDLKLIASGANYPLPPKSAEAFTEDFSKATWVK